MFSLNLTSTSGLILNSGSSLVLAENTILNYGVGSTIKLNEGILEIRNKMEIAPGATFTFSYDAGYDNGTLRFAPYDPDYFMVAGRGSRFVLPTSTSSKPVLDIQENTSLGDNFQTGDYFDRVELSGSHINVATGKYLHTGAPVLRMDRTTITGGGTISVHRPSALATNGSNFHQISNCIFDGSILSNAPNSSLNQKENLTVTRSLFKNKAKLFNSHLHGMSASNCTFTEHSNIVCSNGLNSEFVDCTFSGYKNLDTPAITIIASYFPVKLKGNTITNYRVGVLARNRAHYGMACNVIADNEIGLSHILLSDVIIAGANQGYNTIVNNSSSNVYINFGEFIDFHGGGNALFNDQTTGGNRRILSGIFNSDHQIQCNSSGEEYYECTNNQWSEENPLAKPTSFPEKFNLRNLDPVSCTSCPIPVRDILPKEYKRCPYIDEIGVGYPSLLGLKAPVGHIPGETYVDVCPSCPTLQTKDFMGTPLTYAINEAALLGSFNDGNDDLKSLELYRQILTYDYPERNGEVYTRLQKAYIYAKAAAGALLANNQQIEVETRMQDIHRVYNPELFEGHSALDIILYDMDKAEFEQYVGRIENTLSQLTDLVEKTNGDLQTMLRQNIARVSAEIQYLAGEILWDDFMDTIQSMVGRDGIIIGDGPNGDGCIFIPNNNGNQRTQSTSVNANFTVAESKPAASQKLKIKDSILVPVFSINPNPAREKVLVSVANKKVTQHIRLVDISGKEMMAPLVLENELIEFSVREIPVGIYFVQLFENNVLVNTQKLLIIK